MHKSPQNGQAGLIQFVAPHLHFHIMDGLSTLGSNGLPYVIDSFDFAGQISAARYHSSPNLDGSWNENLLPTPFAMRSAD
jgi:hypothetical protein